MKKLSFYFLIGISGLFILISLLTLVGYSYAILVIGVTGDDYLLLIYVILIIISVFSSIKIIFEKKISFLILEPIYILVNLSIGYFNGTLKNLKLITTDEYIQFSYMYAQSEYSSIFGSMSIDEFKQAMELGYVLPFYISLIVISINIIRYLLLMKIKNL